VLPIPNPKSYTRRPTPSRTREEGATLDAKVLTSLHSHATPPILPKQSRLALSPARCEIPPSFAPSIFTHSHPSTPPPSAAAPLPAPAPPMQSRPAAERPSRLSLLPLVRDLDEVAAGQPAPTPSGPKSEMEWDEEEAPRAKEKVRDLFLRVLSRREKQKMAAVEAVAVAKAPAKPKAKAKAMQQSGDGAKSISGHGSSVEPSGIVKRGSILNARRGIAERRQLGVSLQHVDAQHFTH
jgi:hypothetical protein